ncbi:DNA polymerase processivity factor [Vibrio phage K469]
MSNTVKLSDRTKSLLSNFSKIHPSILLEEGNMLRIGDETGSIYAQAEIEETLPMEFPIFQTSGLLSVLNLGAFKECELAFHDEDAEKEQVKRIEVKGNGSMVDYWASSESLVDLPPEEPPVEEVDYSIELSAEGLSDFKKACAALGLDTAVLKNEGGRAYLTGTNPELDNSNDYHVDMGATDKEDCEIAIKVENIKVLPGNYTVEAVTDMLVRFTSLDKALKYFIGAELD